MPNATTVGEMRRAVQELGAAAAMARRARMGTVGAEFAAGACRHPWRLAMVHADGRRMTYGTALQRSVATALAMRPLWKGDKRIGVIAPPTVESACLHIAAHLSGRVVVPIDPSLEPSEMRRRLDLGRVRLVVAARACAAAAADLAGAHSVAYLEDVAAPPPIARRVFSRLLTMCFSARHIPSVLGMPRGAGVDSDAAIVFTAGTTGPARAVRLTNGNILAETEGLAQVLAVENADRILGVVPFHRAFGFTANLWFPLLRGFAIIECPEPESLKETGRLAARHHATALAANPAYLALCVERVEPTLFGSIRFVVAGGDPLTRGTAEAFEDRFGLRPHEAYGCAECTAAVAVSVPGFRAPGFYQVGERHHRAGHPLPGVAVVAADPATGGLAASRRAGRAAGQGPHRHARLRRRFRGHHPRAAARVVCHGRPRVGGRRRLHRGGGKGASVTDAALIVGDERLGVRRMRSDEVALDLMRRHGMKMVFETARMCSLGEPAIETAGVFGVTTFELG